MNRYTEYKDSGVEWIGEIPATWDSKKLTFVTSSIGSGATPKSDNDQYYRDGTIPWLVTGDLNDGIVSIVSNKINILAIEDYPALKVWPARSLAIAMYGATIGKVGLLQFPTTVNQANCVFVFNSENCPKFWLYVFLANRSRIVSMRYGGGQPNISQELLKSLRFACPQIEEQSLISTYLDKKTSQIDSLIEKIEQKTELLKEQRTTLISQCVTKGFDPNVEMKDSGVEWIGEIPSHWEIGSLKHFSSHINIKRHAKKNESKISPENVESGTGKVLDHQSDYENIGMEFGFGDTLLNKLRVYLAKFVFCEFSGLSMGEMIVLRPISIDPKFQFYLLSSCRFIDYLNSLSEGVKMPRTPIDGIMKSQVPITTVREQSQISQFLDKKTSQIDSLSKKLQRKIELLKEYRQSLISSVVTGKDKVTEDAS